MRPNVLPTEICGQAVELRQLVEAHAPAIVDGITSSLSELGPWFPWAQTIPIVQDQIDRAVAAQAAFAAGTDFEFSVFEAGTEALVGGLRLNPAVSPGTAEIGYWMRSDRHRRGYATEAARLVTAATFEHLGAVNEIEIRMDPANRPSQGVATNAGYELDRKIARLPQAPAHTGWALVWTMQRS